MRVSLLLSLVVALGAAPLVACEFHAGTTDPPAVPTTTPAAAIAPTSAPVATEAPAPTGPKTEMRTGGVHLDPPTDAGI
ncbi:MAG: hypothetical protein ABI461_24385 [Polyangiaceae bacterium]